MIKKYLQSIVLAGVLIATPKLSIPSNINTPLDLTIWMIDNLTYQYDKEDYWKRPEETLRDKGGDCEDFAILVRDFLKKKGYKVYLFLIAYSDHYAGHAITVIKHPDKTYSHFDNRYYISRKFRSIKQLLTYNSSLHGYEWERACLAFNKHFGLNWWKNK